MCGLAGIFEDFVDRRRVRDDLRTNSLLLAKLLVGAKLTSSMHFHCGFTPCWRVQPTREGVATFCAANSKFAIFKEMSMNTFKSWIAQSAFTDTLYKASRATYHRVRKLAFYISDARQTFRDMRWGGRAVTSYVPLSSELLFQYHKLEKGMCMPGERRFFGYDPAINTLNLLARWRQAGFSTQDRIYLGAIETLRAYRQRVYEAPIESTKYLRSKLDAELSDHQQVYLELQTPYPFTCGDSEGVFNALELLATQRRSVRSFQPQAVNVALVQRAARVAQLSPSACNRQPWRLHHYSDRNSINAMLELQNGNRGFGHTIPTLLVLTSDARAFFDASERHEPYIDGGLFAMSLVLALQAQGIASCCLNWCVEPAQDLAAHRVGQIPANERIVMYIAAGYANDTALVPRSPRREIDNVLVLHSNS
jgi:nitroreductase